MLLVDRMIVKPWVDELKEVRVEFLQITPFKTKWGTDLEISWTAH